MGVKGRQRASAVAHLGGHFCWGLGGPSTRHVTRTAFVIRLKAQSRPTWRPSLLGAEGILWSARVAIFVLGRERSRGNGEHAAEVGADPDHVMHGRWEFPYHVSLFNKLPGALELFCCQRPPCPRSSRPGPDPAAAMSRTSRSGGFLPPLWPPPPGEPGGVWQDGKLEPGPLWPPRGQLWWTRAIKGQDGAIKEGEEMDLVAWSGRGASQASFSGPRLPSALGRLRAALLRLQREREELLLARDCARSLQATLCFLKAPRPFVALSQLCRELLPHTPHGTTLCLGVHTDPQFRPLALPLGLVIQRLDMAIEEQLKVLGQASPSPALVSQISELLQVLPAYHQVLAVAVGAVPRAAQPFPPSRVLRLLARERGRQGAEKLWRGLRESKLQTQLHKLCREERELLPWLLGLLGDPGAPGSGSRSLGGSRQLWGQYWSLFWAACAQNLGQILGPWEDVQKAVQQLRGALDQASLPQECEKELTSLCHYLLRQALTRIWDQGFCRALGSARGNHGIMPVCWDGTLCMRTADLFQQLFPPLTSALQEQGSAFCQSLGSGPSPLALGLCTLQAATLWFLSKYQQHLALWAPRPLLLLTQRELPLLLCEAEALAALVSEGASVLELDWQLGKEIQRLTAQIQLKTEENKLLLQTVYYLMTAGKKKSCLESLWSFTLVSCPHRDKFICIHSSSLLLPDFFMRSLFLRNPIHLCSSLCHPFSNQRAPTLLPVLLL
ncbi:coiled-coil domain-containing protein 142 isoform X2 [Phascolarctos cinereus]|uniref:Coiled-coil domain-containing protein 142 isoform X2 n=1 Tax=Phascolarctos cinereus TaxID=38626 RepID=A0A6P5LR50_PHACI|nr:coiled-coil domain-containing protein 142 isoform X2 [Phascolarctos cinereus]